MTEPAITEPVRRGFRADVQGLRAIAVGLVLVYHAGVPIVTGGYVGVDVFFVISGFLISSHLLETLQRDGRIRFADFYARRIRRILPASLTVAILTAAAAIVFYPPLALERVLRDGLATLLYVPNVWFAIQDTDYLADHSASPFQHYWSLGVEEQFYLLWPLLLLLIFIVLRGRSVLVIAAITAVGAVSFVAGAILTQVDQPSAFFLLPTRAWELLIGALVGAVLLHESPRIPGWLAAAGGWLGIAMVFASALWFDDDTAFPGIVALLPTFGTALVLYFGATTAKGSPSRVLSIRPIQFVGLISYSLYLVHWPLLVITQAAVGEQNPLGISVKVVVGIALAIPLAWLLFRFIETPFRSPRALVDRPPRVTLLTALGLTLVLAGTSLAAVQWASARDVGTGEVVAVAPDFPESPPRATEFVPRNMSPALDEVAADLAPLFTDGCQHDVNTEDVQNCTYGNPQGDLDVAMFGDSHTAQWFPAIEDFAAEHPETAIHTYTKTSCSAVSVTVLVKGVPYASCDRWKERVVEHLLADPPDLVVMSSYAHYVLADVKDDAERLKMWSSGLASTIDRLRGAGIEVLIIADSPRFPTDPPTCVSTDVLDVTSCDGDREWAIDDALAAAERNVADASDATYVDLTDFICDAKICPVIIDDIFVYRDINHMTSTFVSYLTPALEPTLEDLLDTGSESAP
ncbi:acyltransferase family protein [Microbacterium murale]|uniref:Acyltransferase n=1 Tax=Microbacterium murale TaxID=1081040 RepID=A0ABQ1RJ04_9MICO|nr:acyltransferase family protein [Microbacterium murale]GGD72123.1 acyltransferase [Microbacterium murale]